jgi:hypothetical protein
MRANDDNLERRDFPEVLDALGRLRREIDRQTYPGEAWPARRRRTRGVVLRLVIASAAAAAVLLAAAVAYWLTRGGEPVPPGPQRHPSIVQATQPAGEDQADEWAIPTDVDLSLAAWVSWELPSADMPSPDDDANAAVDWSIPAAAFPSLLDVADGEAAEADSADGASSST